MEIFKSCFNVILGNLLYVALPEQEAGPDGLQRYLNQSVIL